MNHTMRTAILLLLLGATLSGCARRTKESAVAPEVFSADAGVEWSWRITHDRSNLERVRPSGLLGVFIAHYLVHLSTVESALRGIEAYAELRGDTDAARDEDYALLETLGAAVQVDVPDLLNRSAVRAVGFDTYVEALANLLRRSTTRMDRLEQERDQVTADRRERRREVTTIQRELNTALREKQYAAASDIQQRLLTSEAELSALNSRLDMLQSTIRLYERLFAIGERRLIAMHENREVLIAGLRVVDLPNIEDLGLIERTTIRALQRERGTFDYLFEGL